MAKNPAAVALGRLGGRAKARNLPPEKLRELNQKAGRARWENMTPAEQRAHIERLTRARRKAQKKRRKKAAPKASKHRR